MDGYYYNSKGEVYFHTDTIKKDRQGSIYALRCCIGQVTGIATENPRVLVDITVIRGKENIVKELEKWDSEPSAKGTTNKIARISEQ